MATGTLTTSGSPTFNGDGSCSINSPDRVSCPDVTLVSQAQMWFAMRFKTTWASTDANEHTMFRFGPDTNNELFVQYGAAAAAASAGRDSPFGGPPAVIATPVFASGSTHTVVGFWTGVSVSMSWNGAAFTRTGNYRVPTMTGSTLWDIGQRGYSASGYIDSAVFWVATGLGTLSDADAATLAGLSDTGNTLANFPLSAMFLWSGIDTTYEFATFGIAWTGQ